MDKENSQEDAIERLYRQQYTGMLAYARVMLRDTEQAREAVQETFAIACTRREALCECGNPEGWLMNTLKNVVRNVRRRQRRAALMLQRQKPSEDWDDDLTQKLEVNLLYGDLADSEAFWMMKQIAAGRTMLDIAQELNITVTACRKRAQRAREKLQKALKDGQQAP